LTVNTPVAMTAKACLESFASPALEFAMPRKPATPNEFGARLAALRKAAGITQTAFAAEIGVSQRMMAYYEGPAAQPPANLLPAMAQTLGVSIDALLGTETSRRKAKASDTRMQRRLQQIASLPADERRQLLQLVDTFIEHGKLKQRINHQAA
jgi:transcriptional regulator with XRE-family HTH domain